MVNGAIVFPTSDEGLCLYALDRGCTLWSFPLHREFRIPGARASSLLGVVEMPYSIDRFTVVLSDVDAYECALGHVGEERRMAPSVSAKKAFARLMAFSGWTHFSIRKRERIMALS